MDFSNYHYEQTTNQPTNQPTNRKKTTIIIKNNHLLIEKTLI